MLPPAEASECLARIYESFVAQSTVDTWLRGRADARIAGIAMCAWVPKVDVRLHNVVTPAGVGRIASRRDLTVAGAAASIITAGKDVVSGTCSAVFGGDSDADAGDGGTLPGDTRLGHAVRRRGGLRGGGGGAAHPAGYCLRRAGALGLARGSRSAPRRRLGRAPLRRRVAA